MIILVENSVVDVTYHIAHVLRRVWLPLQTVVNTSFGTFVCTATINVGASRIAQQ